MLPTPPDGSDEQHLSAEPVVLPPATPVIRMRGLTLEQFAEVLRLQLSGARRANEAFEKAKVVSQKALSSEINL